MREAAWKEAGYKSEAQFLAYIRSKIRGTIWKGWPIKSTFVKSKQIKLSPYLREKYMFGNRLKYVYECQICEGLFPRKEVQIDHIVECGTMTMQNYADFINGICCGSDNMQFLCKDCHDVKTHMERYDLPDIDYAERDKKRVEFFKQSIQEQEEEAAELGLDFSNANNKGAREIIIKKHYNLHL